jgi:hypothetical protein
MASHKRILDTENVQTDMETVYCIVNQASNGAVGCQHMDFNRKLSKNCSKPNPEIAKEINDFCW